MKIQVRFFGSVKDDAGIEGLVLDIPQGSHFSDLKEILKKDKPSIWQGRRQIFFALNQNYINGDQELRENDEVAVFPMVSGGC
ncbi:MAG: MoaD/ThiS family protein [Thermoplasmataceae archaeon]